MQVRKSKQAINETQKNIVSGLLYSIFEELREKDPEYALNVLHLLKLPARLKVENEQFQIADSELEEWQETIDQISNIYAHPCPQNRAENYPYFAPSSDPSLVVFKDVNGKPGFELQGLLGLTSRNDETADPITKEALIEYLNELISVEVKYHREQYLKCTLNSEDLNTLYLHKCNLENGTLELIEFTSIKENFASLAAFLNLNPGIKNLIIGNVVSYIGIAALTVLTNLQSIQVQCLVNSTRALPNENAHDSKFHVEPFMIAARYGDEVVVEKLLAMKPKYHPILLAQLLVFNFCFIHEKLIADGISIDILVDDDNEYTSLMFCARLDYVIAAKYCLDKGANIELTSRSGMTALHIALERGCADMVELLLKRGASVKSVLANSKKLCEIAITNNLESVILDLGKENALDHRFGEDESGPIHLAVKHKKEQAFRALLLAGASINAKNKLGETPLHLAVKHQSKSILLECLFDNNVDLDSADNEGLTPLHLASALGYRDVVSSLCSRGASVHAKTNKGITPLIMATISNQNACVESLVLNEAQLDAQDNNGCTALHHAAENGLLDITKLLLAKNAAPLICNNEGLTPRVVALNNHYYAVVKAIDDAVNELQNPWRRDLELRASGLFDATPATRLESDFLLCVRRHQTIFVSLMAFLQRHARDLSQSVLDRALRVAAANNKSKAISTLLHMTKANPLATGKNNGKSALHFAFQFDHVDCAFELIQHYLTNNQAENFIIQLHQKDKVTSITPLDIFIDHAWRDLSIGDVDTLTTLVNISTLLKFIKKVINKANLSDALIAECHLATNRLLELQNRYDRQNDATSSCSVRP